MQENQYEKIRLLFFKLIAETKELTTDEFEKIINQVFEANPSITKKMKERLVVDITKMRNDLLN
ncbi:MAG: hypothetical protein PHQ70_08080 [Arcobacter sp.]|uniref:hypothetical protein n=1 Tax=Arcobacter sp. TaxID=1872629 RepID=UPI00258657AF|nr:hypothetical protein [Arcobacter sp.]MDD3008808.1 hypothetical protein [Arcobacter sp.]